MLKISTRGQYALLLMTDLAEQKPDTYTALKDLAHRHNISVKYAEQILIQLSKNNLVFGLRGTNGGYRLNKPAAQYSAGEILRAMEGNLNPKGDSEDIHPVTNTGNIDFWNGFSSAINQYVDSISLEQIAEKNKEADSLMYVI